MGYRSTIIIGVVKKHQEELKAMSGKPSMFEEVDHYPFSNMAIYRGEYLKWYDSFEEVSSINKFIQKIVEDDEDNAFMLGIGEDGQLHTEIGFYHDFCNVYTSVEIYGEND